MVARRHRPTIACIPQAGGGDQGLERVSDALVVEIGGVTKRLRRDRDHSAPTRAGPGQS